MFRFGGFFYIKIAKINVIINVINHANFIIEFIIWVVKVSSYSKKDSFFLFTAK